MSKYLSYLERFEPARVRALWTAIVMLAAGFGVSVSPGVDVKVSGVIGVLGAILVSLQGEWTRARVFSPGTVDEMATRIKELEAVLQGTTGTVPSAPDPGDLNGEVGGYPPPGSTL